MPHNGKKVVKKGIKTLHYFRHACYPLYKMVIEGNGCQSYKKKAS